MMTANKSSKGKTTRQGKMPEELKAAMQDQSIPKIYANGFLCTLGTGDISVVLQSNDQAVGIVNMSYTVAKTFAIKLHGLIQLLERKSDNTIMTTDELNQFLQKGDD